MKRALAITLLILLSMQLDAKSRGVTLNEAVNQAKSEGRVLSARTIRGQHEIKVLTQNGTVKTINKQASRATRFAQNNADHSQPQTWHNKFKNEPLPSRRSKSHSREVMRLEPRNARSRHGYDNYSKRGAGVGNNRHMPSRNRSSSANSKEKDK